MVDEIKNKINKELRLSMAYFKNKYAFALNPSIMFKFIEVFVLSDGKRIRPILFIIAFRLFSKRNPP